MITYLRNLLSGNSTDHFSNAAEQAVEAAVAAGKAVGNGACAAGNAALATTEAALIVGGTTVVVKEVVVANVWLQPVAAIASFIAPGAVTTSNLVAAASVTGSIVAFMSAYPLVVPAVVAAAIVTLACKPTIAAVGYTAKSVYNAGEAAVHAVGAVAEGTAGTALLAKEAVEAGKSYVDITLRGHQDGKGINGNTIATLADNMDDSTIGDEWSMVGLAGAGDTAIAVA